MQPALSLDGFVAKPDGDCYSWVNEADEARYEDAVAKAGCVIVGRKTYEQYIADFPSKSGAVTFVCTSNATDKDTEKIKFVHGTAHEIAQKIADHGFAEAIISGGGEINGLFADAGLVDEIVVSIHSTVLGSGIPLFGTYHPTLELELLSSNQDIAGITQNHYRVVR